MAKINGFELKGIKTFKGHEGEPCQQGNIYYKGKRVGWFSDDSWGGCMDIRFDSLEIEKLFKETICKYVAAYPNGFTGSFTILNDKEIFVNYAFSAEDLISELDCLKELEGFAKSFFKGGAKAVTIEYDPKNAVSAARKWLTSVPCNYNPKDTKLMAVITSLSDFDLEV